MHNLHRRTHLLLKLIKTHSSTVLLILLLKILLVHHTNLIPYLLLRLLPLQLEVIQLHLLRLPTGTQHLLHLRLLLPIPLQTHPHCRTPPTLLLQIETPTFTILIKVLLHLRMSHFLRQPLLKRKLSLSTHTSSLLFRKGIFCQYMINHNHLPSTLSLLNQLLRLPIGQHSIKTFGTHSHITFLRSQPILIERIVQLVELICTLLLIRTRNYLGFIIPFHLITIKNYYTIINQP